MTFKKQKNSLIIIVLIAFVALVGCNIDGPDPDLDTTAPTVTSTSPVDGAINVAINSSIAASFSEAMDPETIDEVNFTLVDDGATAVSGTVSYDAGTETASFNPAADLAAGTTYTATITTGAKDLAGNALGADKTWTFTTGSTSDTTAPTVTSTSPVDGATDVAINSNITASFSEKMDPTTIDEANFTLADGATSVSGTVTYDIGNTAAIFTPDSNLNANTTYTVTVTTDVTDTAGNAMATDRSWTFTTAAAEGSGPELVNLGTAGNYAILAKTAISTVPNSAITGDLGLSPAATSYITGFSLTQATGYATSTQVTGKIYAATMADPTPINLTTAVSDMEAAYTDAAGRTTPDYSELGTGEIGGLTLDPGLYKWTSTVNISSDVTISGTENDVWIFQIAGDLTAANDINVILGGNAQAKNIFWQVAGEATVGTNAHFEGILLSQTGITLGTGASMNGRALAQSAVALDQNTVVEPAD